ncbi:class I adenylate-forming enzyme family protein [Changpingibacter yushuensis]|uniref:class I adenylate-forming enzyme family protein n=1 Tax=Changpingibacter yushuensis TaxID=2758440 RepID=UPI00165D5D9F|nr:class I adenylate-forming enzyme family protein [Changpingibacter yushuensis]
MYSSNVLSCENLAEPFMAHAILSPDRLAVVDGGVSLTYGELSRKVRAIASYLKSEGVQPGDRVAYLLPNSSDLVALFYALQFVGAAAVPINHRSVGVEVAFFLCATQSRFVFVDDDVMDQVQEAADSAKYPVSVIGRTLGTPSLASISDGPIDESVEMNRDAQAVARIQFTGGSTGIPKGVVRTHRADLVNVFGTASSNNLFEDPTKVVLIQSPIDHHGGHAWLTQTLSLGGTAVLTSKFEPERIMELVETNKVSYLMLLPPSTYIRLMENADLQKYDLSSLRLVQTSAGGIEPQTIRRMYEAFPTAVVNYGWGQTESGLGTSLVFTREMVEAGDPKLRSAGKPMPMVEVRVIDDEEHDVPVGTLGQGVVRSEAVMRGYYGQEALTNAAFTKDGWLKTGDVLSMDEDGYVYLHSRIREIIKSGGENVFISEVEEAVRSHPAVIDCMVYGIRDKRLGEAVAVAVELRSGQTLDIQTLQDWVKGQLASFKKPVQMTVLPSLGRDFSGKVDRKKIIADCENANNPTR